MSPAATALIAEFEAAATKAQQAEEGLRKKMALEVGRLERERAFAFRKLNLIREVTKAVASAESEGVAVASGLAVVRAELGWQDDSETRSETLSRFAPIVQATFAGLAPHEAEAHAADVSKELAGFEAWYVARFEQPFWMLFEQYIPEMPLVER